MMMNLRALVVPLSRAPQLFIAFFKLKNVLKKIVYKPFLSIERFCVNKKRL